jgi:hypothetical protein
LGRPISNACAQKSRLLLGNQKIAATEVNVRATNDSIILETPRHPFEEGVKLSMTPGYRDKKMVSCVYCDNLIGLEVVDVDERGFVNIPT